MSVVLIFLVALAAIVLKAQPVPDVTGTATPVTITAAFSPNATTISTSEGASYGDCDIWASSICTDEANFGYGPTKIMRLYICLSGEVPAPRCSERPSPKGPLSEAVLNRIDSGIAAYRGSGIRLLV